MSAPVDEIDVGRDPRGRLPWQDWSPGRRRAVAVIVAVAVLVAGVLWFVLRETEDAPAAAPAPVATAPGADVVQDLGPDPGKCPPTVRCRYDYRVTNDDESAFRAAFASAGYIGRQSVLDADTNEVYWQLIRFSTGTLVTVTLSQQPVAQLPALPVVDDTPEQREIANGSATLTAVRDGYLMTATVAGLPGQALPVGPAQQWVRSVPAPGA